MTDDAGGSAPDRIAAHPFDARGLRCPWPALRLAALLRQHAAVALRWDDPAVPAEVAALAAHHGWQVAADGEILLVEHGR